MRSQRQRALFAALAAVIFTTVAGQSFLPVLPTDEVLSFNETDDAGEDVEFHIYTRSNPVSPIVVATNSSASHVDPSLDLVVIVHGFTGSVSSNSVTLIRNALLFKFNITVVAVQWAHLARGPWYDKAAENTEVVAQHLSDFLLQLEANGVDLERVHVIGFSLGAHVAGFCGSLLQGRLGRITGLDPARPGFENRNSSGRLDASDAQFVVGLHTGAGFVALLDAVGHVDFYPNGGSRQPHCEGEDIPLVCNHFMAYTYFAESIYNKDAFPSLQCSSWKDFEDGLCDGNVITPMGYHTPNISRGLYFLRTNAQEPYGQGQADRRIDLDVGQEDPPSHSDFHRPQDSNSTRHVQEDGGGNKKDIYALKDGLNSSDGVEVHSLNDLESSTHLSNNACKLGFYFYQMLLIVLFKLLLLS